MNDLETKNVADTGAGDLSEQCAALQRQINTLLLALVVLSGTFAIFMWRQSRYAHADLEAAKNAAGPALNVFKQKEKPAYDTYEAHLAEFARTHPDFKTLMNSFQIQLTPGPTAPAMPAPASAPTAPKPATAAPAAPGKK